VHAILKEDVSMRRVCAKFVPRLLSNDQMECRKTIVGDLFEQSTQDPSSLGKVISEPQEVPSNKIQHQGHVGGIFR
jgi:hypothetical protein